MEGSAILSSAFFSWWYFELYHRLIKFFRQFLIYLADLFSVKICLTTLFAPWKRDRVSYEGLSLREKFEVWTLNLSSRIIGALIKIFTVITFAVAFFSTLVIISIVFIIWLLYPIVLLGIAIWGIQLIVTG
jgi:hypothetical protein